MGVEFKPVWGKDKITFEWCEYSFDSGMITVRESITKDVAKFKTQADAMAYIKQQEAIND